MISVKRGTARRLGLATPTRPVARYIGYPRRWVQATVDELANSFEPWEMPVVTSTKGGSK